MPNPFRAIKNGMKLSKHFKTKIFFDYMSKLAQVQHTPKIIETVLAPMSITKLDPMKRVRELERIRALIEAGLAFENDFEEDSVNKMIGTSSGYYKFNHMYKRMREYWNQIEKGSKDHAVFQIPYTALPEGFLDPKNIENAKRVMSSHEFAMEYLAAMVNDSEGFFKASVLEKCSTLDFTVEMHGDNTSNYVLGIDPNQGGSAKCGAVVIKLGNPHKVVRVLALDGKTTQDITTSIQELCVTYNIIKICMDKGGGGKAVSDLLEEGYNGYEPIVDILDKNKIAMKGRHILELITFSTAWIEVANYTTLSLLEDAKIQFPISPTDAVSDLILDSHQLVEKLKKQCLNIVVTQTSSGALHFDTPKKGQNKDLYSSFILACYGIKRLESPENVENKTNINLLGGLIRSRDSQSWKQISNDSSTSDLFSGAVLKRK